MFWPRPDKLKADREPIPSMITSCPRTRRCQGLPLLTLGLIAAAFFGLAHPAMAQLGARTTEQWLKTLDSKSRLEKLQVDKAVGVLGLKPGSVVADVGAGAGASR